MWLDHLLYRETYPLALESDMRIEDELVIPRSFRIQVLAFKLTGSVNGLLAQVVRAHP